MKDGTQLSKEADAVRGTAKNPMSHEEVVGKASDLMSSVLGASKSGELIHKVFGLTQVKGIKDLRPLLQP